MVFITEDLIRKKSEHNELLISTLEELSLHQEDIEKIEHLQNWCRELRILLLQSNLIPKIENLHKLKKLEYLNLGLNNIERIENLNKLESLTKLDLTLNFIGELTSVANLVENYNLRELILTGNPCTDFPGYRDYVIALLPQLELLDGVEIKVSDRIKAKKSFAEILPKIVQAEAEYKITRDEQKIRVQQQREQFEAETAHLDEDEKRKRFWNAKSEHCPETRADIVRQHRERTQVKREDEKSAKKAPTLFAPCGRPYNINQAKLKFRLVDEADYYELDLSVYKHLDTSLIDVDVEANYLRVTVKGKVFQLALNDEVSISDVIIRRSQMTGQLQVIMKKLKSRSDIAVCMDKSKQWKVFPYIVTQTNMETAKKLKDDDLKGTVNYKNIVKTSGKHLPESSQNNNQLDTSNLVNSPASP